MYIKHKINNIQTMKFIKSPRQDYTTYFLFFTLFSTKQKKTEASVLNFQMAEKEGFEPPRLLHPVGFQDQSLQPDLGISPYNFYQNMVDLLGLEPRTDRL